MKLLNLAVAITGFCDLAFAVPGAPGSAVSSQKTRRRCSKRPHSLATSKTRSGHAFSSTKSQTVIIHTSTTKSTTTTGPPGTTTSAPASTTTAAPPDTTTTAPPDTTTAPPDTTTAPPDTTTAPPDTTTAPPDTTTAPPDTTTAPPDTTTAPPDTTTAPPDTTTAPPTTTTAPPPVNTCGAGTAFGYRPPVNGVVQSPQLDSTDGIGCNRWGWYTTPTLAQLQAVGGVSGQLLVGAGNNNVDAATNVGTYTATANALGGVTVTYLVTAPYALAEVHVDLRCLPIPRCAPGQYVYVNDEIPALQTWSNPTPLAYPTCAPGTQAYLIVHAAVVELTTEACD